jgi:hypothetical protein
MVDDNKIYSGLVNRNTGFDAAAIIHLNSEDMLKALARLQYYSCGYITVEAFASGKFEACSPGDCSVTEAWTWVKKMIKSAPANMTFNFTYSGPA